MAFNKLLTVCTGNICRSPLAEGRLRKMLPNHEISSAGIAAVEGGRMPAEAQTIASRDNLALDTHRGRQLVAPIVRGADIILVMENGQRAWITERYPEAKGRVFLATHWLDGHDIDDPFRRDADYFERVYDEIVESMNAWAEKLGNMNRQ